MNCKLVKEVKHLPSKTKDGKELVITNFYLQLENGENIRIMPNVWEDDTKKKHSNFSVLSVLASDINKLPF